MSQSSRRSMTLEGREGLERLRQCSRHLARYRTKICPHIPIRSSCNYSARIYFNATMYLLNVGKRGFTNLMLHFTYISVIYIFFINFDTEISDMRVFSTQHWYKSTIGITKIRFPFNRKALRRIIYTRWPACFLFQNEILVKHTNYFRKITKRVTAVLTLITTYRS